MEILFPGSAPVAMAVPADGLQDADGNPVAEINFTASEFSMPCPVPVPVGAMVRVRARHHHAG